ncbi:cytochrome P450 [Halalkalicoccus subterraneus]|uniref:cytochrome P450 n=1 Tax=Halalkalicoccus subterraneus TaxID=2675002 RepID=UPI000EFAAAF9|nr:cytochrome P450 [Halalkalicoccus subterraneus]
MAQSDDQQFLTLPAEAATTARQRDPFPWFRERHAESPVRYDPDRRSWDVFGYAAVKRVLGDPEAFTSNGSMATGGDLDIIGTSLINTDPPRHDRLRSMVESFFRPGAIADLESDVERIASDLLDEAESEMDLVEEFAYPLPVMMIAELLGVPTEDRAQFREWSLGLAGDTDLVDPTTVNTDRAERIQGELGVYLTDLIEQRKADPRDDLVSALIEEDLSEWDLLGFCALLLVAGNITTTNLLTNAVRSFSDAEDGEAIHEDLPAATEETIRYRAPVQAIARYATRDATVAGERIEAGEHVHVWLGAANHDPTVFDSPEMFRPGREVAHVGFGHGIHYCLGAQFARLEARVALETLYDRYPNLAVVDGEHPPVTSPFLHGLRSLPVRLE